MDPVRARVGPAARSVHAVRRRRRDAVPVRRNDGVSLRRSGNGAAPARRHAAPRWMHRRRRCIRDRRVRRRRPGVGAQPRRTDELSLASSRSSDAGPFAWGPQGDRVLLSGFEIRGVGARRAGSAGDRHLGERLRLGTPARPRGRVRRRGGHPEEALRRRRSPGPARVAARRETTSRSRITRAVSRWRSWWKRPRGRRSGSRPTKARIRSGSSSPSRPSSPRSRSLRTGRILWWTAQHEGDIPELHFMKLDDRTGFGTAWRGLGGNGGGRPSPRAGGPLSGAHRRRSVRGSPRRSSCPEARRGSRCPTRRGPPRRWGGSTERRCWSPPAVAASPSTCTRSTGTA